MANERITEQFFRNLINKDELYKNNKIIFEEQSSKNKKLDKLLQNASKSGNNKGYPEFIIQFKENPDFVIVVECKSNINFHESKNRDKYKDYSVDGVLLYSSFLSKEYDVLSIAISGENEIELKISHFLQLKNTNEAYNIFKNNHFLSLIDYINGYQTDERKFNQDFQALLKYSKTLNDDLHLLKVPESDRSLLISGCLIALSDKAFLKAYQYQSPKELSENLINTIKNKLTNVQNEHIEDIITSYSFIKTHTILSKQENKLRDIITNVDEKINNFIRTYEYFDTLGQFYIEFLRYANNDKGLGIVLTPPHITELFCEIANINKNSIVLDTCTGTGGFLISAMKKMILDAGGDSDKEKKIKREQIVGIEFQHSIFSLTCSNMYIHGDGRSNLIKGNCFNEEIKNEVDKYKPNTGLLNPPYKTNKNDKHELEFILNNLSLLQKNSYCVAIIPMSCAIESDTITIELKNKLLANHTLEAVFSMPNELFYNSNVSVNTCIMVFKAHEKHPANYKTYFALWDDDGFIKVKKLGRLDIDNKWNSIRKNWIKHYKNKDEITGHSVKGDIKDREKKLNEWCYGYYASIDYNLLTDDSFKENIHNYLVFKVQNKEYNFLNELHNNKNNQKIKINFNTFKEIQLNNLFNIDRGKRLKSYDRKKQSNKVPYISSTTLNNGVDDYVDTFSKNKFEHKGKFLTVVCYGEPMVTFYQEGNFWVSDSVMILKPKFDHFNFLVGLFFKTILEKYKPFFNYGRGATKERLNELKIKVPLKKDNRLDIDFINEYMKTLNPL